MERRLPAGAPKAAPLLSELRKRREMGLRGRHPGEGATGLLDPELLDLPLGVKIPVLPKSRPVFTRAKLGEKLHQPSGYFNLGDPHCRLLQMEYNSLHDPHLQAFHTRRKNLQRLWRAGQVTSDGRVVCTLKEFNEYRQYLTTLKLRAEQVSRQEEERLRQLLAQLKDSPKASGAIGASRPSERLLQRPKAKLQPQPQPRTARVSRPRHTTPLESISDAFSRAQQWREKRTGHGRTILPKIPGTEEKTELEMQPELTASARTLALTEMAEHIVEAVLERIRQTGPAATPDLNSGRHVAPPPTPGDAQESCPAQDGLPSRDPQLSRQPDPPAAPEPPAQTGARRRVLRLKLIRAQPQQPQ